MMNIFKKLFGTKTTTPSTPPQTPSPANSTAEPSKKEEQKRDKKSSVDELLVGATDLSAKVDAIAQLESEADLQRLVKHFRGKQKRLYRAAKERLGSIRERQNNLDALQKQADNLAAAMVKQSISHSAVAAFDKQLQALQTLLSDAQQQQFTQQLELAKRSAGHIEQLKNERLQLIDELGSLLRQLQDQTYTAQREALDDAINNCQHRWAQLTPWQSEEARALAIRFEQALSSLNTAAGGYFVARRELDDCERVLAQGQRWLDKGIFISPSMLQDWQHRWQALALPTNSEHKSSAEEQFNSLRQQLQDRSEQQLQQQQDNDQKVPKLVEELANMLENGEVQPAVTAQNAIRRCLRSEVGLSKKVYQSVIGRFKRQENRLNELLQWQHFGKDQVRQELLESMLALRDDSDLPIAAKADHIRQLQQRWKSLGGHAPTELWKQFQQAGDEAWRPCAEYFKSQRQTSQNDLQQRLDFLDAAHKHLSEVNWQNPNWQALSDAHRKFEKMWRDFSKLREKDYRKAKKAYQKVAAIWDEHLGAERRRELQRREQLISTAQELTKAEDTAIAVSTAKNLQQQWSPTVPLKRHEQEQALWNRFKSACDDIFDNHNKQLQAHTNEQKQQQENYQKQLDELAVGVLDEQSVAAAKQILDDTTAKLGNFDGVSAESRQHFKRQLHQLTQKFAERQHQALAKQRDLHLEELRQQDMLCIQLETELKNSQRLPQLEKTWESISPALNDGQANMHRRFQQALQAQQQGQLVTAAKDTIEQAETICLILEMCAEIDSPDYAEQQRKSLQIKNLDAAMNGDKSFENHATEAGLYRLSVEWLSLPKGGLNEAQSQMPLPDWRARFENALTANQAKIHRREKA